jgi:hypothetical protein
MVPQTYERFSSQQRDSALIWGRWSTATGVPTKLAGHSSLQLTRTGTGAYRLDVLNGAREAILDGLPYVTPATPGTIANHRYVVPVAPVAVASDLPQLTFGTWRNATEAVAAAQADPEDGSVITLFAVVAK